MLAVMQSLMSGWGCLECNGVISSQEKVDRGG